MSIRFLIALVSTGLLMTALPAKAETGENGGSDDAIKLTWDNGIVITRKGLDWFRDLIVTPFASIYEALNPPADSVIDANTEIDFTETPTSFVATFDGFGAVKRSEENISVEIKGKYWRFNGDINVYNEVTLEGTSDDADKIELTSATLRHTYGPPDYSGDHGPADSLRPNVFYVANQSGLEPGGDRPGHAFSSSRQARIFPVRWYNCIPRCDLSIWGGGLAYHWLYLSSES